MIVVNFVHEEMFRGKIPIRRFKGNYFFLSNFAPSEVYLYKKKYPTVEHAFQAAKCNTCKERTKIQHAKTPAQAKRLGKKVDLRKDWDDIKLKIMEDLLIQKFSNLEYRTKLKATRARTLIEGNTWGDTYWGVCNDEGKNHLGKLLMSIRDEIIKEQWIDGWTDLNS